jgi:hypothetical protein
LNLSDRRRRLRSRSDVLGRWCIACERRKESVGIGHRVSARVVRWFFEVLVLVLIVLAEIVLIWHRAGGALAVRPRR